VRGHCGGALMCRVVDSNASITWSGMRRSETTHDPHLTVLPLLGMSRCLLLLLLSAMLLRAQAALTQQPVLSKLLLPLLQLVSASVALGISINKWSDVDWGPLTGGVNGGVEDDGEGGSGSGESEDGGRRWPIQRLLRVHALQYHRWSTSHVSAALSLGTPKVSTSLIYTAKVESSTGIDETSDDS